MGLNPNLIKDWWWVLVFYNVVVIFIAGFYVFLAVSKVKKDNKNTTMIQTQAQLSDFLHNIENETELVIDTEFKRVNTYYPLLCLVQISAK
jgi:hypothetical protein